MNIHNASVNSSVKTLLLALTIIFSQVSLADCRDAYKDKIRQLDGRMNPPLGVMTANTAAAAAVPAIILATGGVVTVAGSIALPAVAVGAGAYYTVLAVRKNSFQRSLKLLNDSNKGSGAQLDRFLKKLEKQGAKAEKNEVLAILAKANADKLFCPENNYTGKTKPFAYHRIRRFVMEKITGTILAHNTEDNMEDNMEVNIE